MEIKNIAELVDSWRLNSDWKTVVTYTMNEYSGDLLESLSGVSDADELDRRLKCNKVRIERIIAGVTKNRRKQQMDIAPAVIAGFDAWTGDQVLSGSIAHAVAAVSKECSEAISAKLLNFPVSVQTKEVREAILSLVSLLPPGVIQLTIREVAA